MLHLDAQQLAARLPRLALIEALGRAFGQRTEVPPRQRHAIGAQGADEASLLIMSAWRDAVLGVKLVTVCPAKFSPRRERRACDLHTVRCPHGRAAGIDGWLGTDAPAHRRRIGARRPLPGGC
jgi:hypothetical protein